MKFLKNLTLLVLALTSIGGAILAWQQYQELVGLRVSALSKDERASLQKRVWDLERYNKELNDQLAALRDASGDEERVAAGAGGQPGDGAAGGGRGQFRGRGGPGGNPQQMFNAVRDLMAKPEVQALLSVQQKAAIDARYASLFKSMNLSSEQADKVKTLLADRQTTLLDVMAAAREQGVDPRTDRAGFQQLVAGAQNDINNGLKAVLGDAGFSQLQNYEQTMPQRNVVNQLQQRLSYTDTPLSQAQADQLVQVLATNSPPARTNANGTPAAQDDQGGRRNFGGGGPGGDIGGAIGALLGGGGGGVLGMGGGPGGGGQTAPITPAAVNQASSVLAAPQVDALKQLQQQQQAQQQLQQIMRSTFESQNQNAGGKATTGNTPATTNTRRKGGG